MIVCDLCKGEQDVKAITIEDEVHELCLHCRKKQRQWLNEEAVIITKEEHATWLKSISKE